MNYLFIIISALLLNTAKYFPNLYLLTWLGFIPLLFAFDKERSKLFFKGWLFGFVYLTAAANFLINPLRLYTGLNIIIISLLLLILFAVLGLIFGLFFKAYFYIFSGEINPFYFALGWLVFAFLRYRLLNFFPIGYLVTTQAEFSTFIQLADLGGIWLLTFVLVFLSAFLYKLIFKGGLKELAFLFLVVLLIFGYGQFRLYQFDNFSEEIQLTTVITNLTQSEKWQAENSTAETDFLLEAADYSAQSRLVITPESSLNFDFAQDNRGRELLNAVEEEFETPVQLGSLAGHSDYEKRLNSSFLISAEGEIVDRYNKNRLVYFGEKFPMQNILNSITPYQFSSLGAGDEIRIFSEAELSWQTLICSEVLYTDLLYSDMDRVDFLVNQSNEAWFDNSTVLKNMMWSSAVLRAVESRRPLVKAGNLAYSGKVEASGLYQKTELNSNYHNLNITLSEQNSFYSSYYILFEILLYLLTGLFIILLLLKRFFGIDPFQKRKIIFKKNRDFGSL